MKLTKNNPYYNITNGEPNCTAWADQCVYENGGAWLKSVGNPYNNSHNTSMWNTNDGYNRHQYRSKVKVGQIAIFKSGSTGHVAYVYKVDKNYIYLSEQNYGDSSGRYLTKLSKTPGVNHPRWNLELVGFRGTPASVKYEKYGTNQEY